MKKPAKALTMKKLAEALADAHNKSMATYNSSMSFSDAEVVVFKGHIIMAFIVEDLLEGPFIYTKEEALAAIEEYQHPRE
jgi:hypothetical protein